MGDAGDRTSSPLASVLNLQSLNLGEGRKDPPPHPTTGFLWRGGWCRKKPGLALLTPAALDGHMGGLSG